MGFRVEGVCGLGLVGKVEALGETTRDPEACWSRCRWSLAGETVRITPGSQRGGET